MMDIIRRFNNGFDHGYSLLEVLMASVLLGIVALPLTSLFMIGYNHVNASGEKTAALAYGVQEMERLKSQGYSALKNHIDEGYEQSPVDSELLSRGYERYHKIREVRKKLVVNDEEIEVEVLLLEVYVNWSGLVDRELILTSYLSKR